MKHSLLDLYTDYLISSFGQVTATGLSRLVEGQISHDQVTRFLASAPKTSAELWAVVKPVVRQIERDDGVVIVDDSIEEKPHSEENDITCWHWDHAKGRNVKGINFLSALYCAGGTALPVAFDLVSKTEFYIDAKSGGQKRRSTITKNERYGEMLSICVKNRLHFSYVVNDVWYASAENMKFVKNELRKGFVMPLKANRKVAVSQSDKQRGQYVAVSALELPAGTTRKVWVEEVGFALMLSKELFTNEDGTVGVLYLVTSDLRLSAESMMALYKRRWSVEVYHKSLKQNAGLEKSPAHTETTQNNHLFAALCAYIKLEGLKLKTKLNHFALKSKIYISALQSAYAELAKLKPQPLAA